MNRKKHNNKIELNNQPSWYTQYPWSPIPDDIDEFVGRKIELEGFWYEMAALVGRGQGQKTNYAFISQRKMGKTAYLKRCYNIAFWEQEEVVPFYYSFSQNDGDGDGHVIQLSELKREMPIKFLQQFFAYCTKDIKFLDLQSSERIIDHAQKAKFPRMDGPLGLAESIKICLDKINNAEDIYMMSCIWDLTQVISFFTRKKCLLIIDEAQEMEISIYDGKIHRPCKASIADIIQKHHSLVLVSGSNVSMLVNNFLDYSFANRIERCPFTTLEVEEAEELILRRCSNRYKNLAKDLIELVGGNPYYINSILNYNILYIKKYKQHKDFSSTEGLQKAYEFEVLESEGRVHNFWLVHLHKNKEDLNKDPKGKKGLTLQILYKISSEPDKQFTFRELAKEFSVSEEIIERKTKQLVNANLIKPRAIGFFAHAFPDKILPVTINANYHNLIIEGPSKNVAREAIRDYNEMIGLCEKRVQDFESELQKANNRLVSIKKKFFKADLQLISLNKSVKSAFGKMSLQKGVRKENRIRKKIRAMIVKQQHVFADCELKGDIRSINITSSKGTGCQIDIFAQLQDKNANSNFALLAEVKNHKTKTGIADARKFVASVQRAKKEYKLKNIVAVYISKSGFTKGAKNYLEDFDIKIALTEQIFAT